MKLFLVLLVTLPAFPEPGVAVVFDSRQPRQSHLATEAKAFLYRLVRQNGLAAHQFTLRTVDLSTPEGRRFRSTYELTAGDLPALACYQREGNRLTLRSLVRAYQNPLTAAETAFGRIQLEEPRMIASSKLLTAVTMVTDPPGARILHDNNELGITPCQVQLAPGTSRLTVAHEDCLSQLVEVRLSAGEVAERSLVLTPAPCVVTIQSEGPPLAVSLDGSPLGYTPVTFHSTARLHRLSASAPGWKPLDVSFRPQAQTQVFLKPTREQVRISLGEVTADGYLVGRGFDSLPFPTAGVELSSADYTRQLRANLERTALRLVPSAGDCTIRLDVNAWERFVKAELTIADREGRTLQTLSAERGMPWITLDEEGSARRRGAELVDELSADAVRWILQNVPAGPLTDEERRESVRVHGGV